MTDVRIVLFDTAGLYYKIDSSSYDSLIWCSDTIWELTVTTVTHFGDFLRVGSQGMR